MISRLKDHIDKQFPFLKGQKLLLAVSGGIDSVVLVHLFHSLKYDIGIAHVNFQLRGEDSDGDELFVRNLAKQLKVPFYNTRVDTKSFAKSHGLSIQMAARETRYKWFEILMQKYKYDYLLTAHHLDDSIETFIININRKTGLEGLAGIKSINGKIIRPLSEFTREDIKKYAVKQDLQWREDRTNASLKYERNHIRHKLIPIWEKINPTFKTDLKQTMTYLREGQQLIEDYITLVKPKFWSDKADVYEIDLEALTALPHYESVLYHCLKPYGFTDWTSVKNILEAQSGKQVVSEQYVLLKDRTNLQLYKQKNVDQLPKEINDSFTINDNTYVIDQSDDQSLIKLDLPHTEYFDTETIKLPLSIRRWQVGDQFYPLGMTGKKKLSDFFTDQKISVREKEKIWLLCDAYDRIIWIIGYRIDNRFKITDQTKSYLKISRTS